MKRSSRKVITLTESREAGNRQGRNFRRRFGAAGGTPLRLVKPETLRWAFSQSGWNRE